MCRCKITNTYAYKNSASQPNPPKPKSHPSQSQAPKSQAPKSHPPWSHPPSRSRLSSSVLSCSRYSRIRLKSQASQSHPPESQPPPPSPPQECSLSLSVTPSRISHLGLISDQDHTPYTLFQRDERYHTHAPSSKGIIVVIGHTAIHRLDLGLSTILP